MTENSDRDRRNIRRNIRQITDGTHGSHGSRGPQARNLVGTRAVTKIRMRRKVMSWRIARNPLFHASVTDAA